MRSLKFLSLSLSLIFAMPVFASSAHSANKPSLKFIATYLQPGTMNPDSNVYAQETTTHLTATHFGPEYFGKIRHTLQGKKAFIDLADHMFDHSNGRLYPNYKAVLNDLGKKYFDGHESKILAFYIADEPSGFDITRQSLELVIAELKARFKGIPTYIVWNRFCFDNAPELDATCGLPGQRGIPKGLDWVGFDWYLNGTPDTDAHYFKVKIIDTVERLKRISSLPIVLVPDGTDQFLQNYPEAQRDQIIADRMKMHYDYAQTESRIIGLDNYAWANHSENFQGDVRYVKGLREFPKAKNMLYQWAHSLRIAAE